MNQSDEILYQEGGVKLSRGVLTISLENRKTRPEYSVTIFVTIFVPETVQDETSLRGWMEETLLQEFEDVLQEEYEKSLQRSEEQESKMDDPPKRDEEGYVLFGDLRFPPPELFLQKFFDRKRKALREKVIPATREAELPDLVKFLVLEISEMINEGVKDLGKTLQSALDDSTLGLEMEVVIEANPGVTPQNYDLTRRLGRVPTEEEVLETAQRRGLPPELLAELADALAKRL